MTATLFEYDLLTEPRAGYLFARVRAAAVSPELAVNLLRKLRNALTDSRSGCVLLESEIAHVLSDDEVLNFMNELIALLPGVRIAFVSRDPKHRASLKLAVEVGRAAGQEHQLFTEFASAEEWLLRAEV